MITDAERANAERSIVNYGCDEPGYNARALERAAVAVENSVKDLGPSYHKHWALVDAILLRRMAATLSQRN